MKKSMRVITALLCMALVLSGVGCSKKTDTASKQSSGSSEKTDKLKEDGTLDYSSYVKLADYKNFSLKESDIEKKVEETITANIRQTKAYKEKKSGKLKKGDIVNINFEGKMDGSTFVGGSYTKQDYPDGYDVELGSNSFIDGFEQGLYGKKIGKKCKIKVTFPENYGVDTQSAALAGKKAVFTVNINFVKVFSKLSDSVVKKYFKEAIKSYNDTYGRKIPYTAKGYKQYLHEGVTGDLAWDSISEKSEITEYPAQMVSDMKTEMKTQLTNYLTNYYNYTLEQYLEKQNVTEEEFDKQMEESAKTEVGKQIVYHAIADKEGITISDEQYKQELDVYLKRYNQTDEDALNEYFVQNSGSTATTIIMDELYLRQIKFLLVNNYQEKGK